MLRYPCFFTCFREASFFYIVIEKSESTVPVKYPFGTKSYEPFCNEQFCKGDFNLAGFPNKGTLRYSYSYGNSCILRVLL